MAAATLAVALFVFLVASVLSAGLAPAAQAVVAAAPLAVSVDRSLSTTEEPVVVSIAGELSESLVGTRLVVRVKGPATSEQLAEAAPELTETDKVVETLGEVPRAAGTTTGGPPAGTTEDDVVTTTTSSTTTTTLTAVAGSSADLQAGTLDATVTLPSGMPAGPGAYQLVVEVKAGQTVIASGSAWMGKTAPREGSLDLAFVWPVSLGIHRDPAGVFYDRVLEQAVAGGAGDLGALLGLRTRFAGWDFTVAIEPVLLTQLRDMADGYIRLDAGGERQEVAEDAAEAKDAAAALQAFAGLAAAGVEMTAGPYSGADLGLLAAEGWRDGFDQIQMGKQELQQTLGLGSPLTGALSPDLGLTTDSLAYYAQASIDHVVVSSDLAGLLTEQIENGTVAVRARDAENDRVTLVFADSTLGGAMTTTWDVGRFCATLAVELAAGPRDALVVVPQVQFTLAPAAFLEALGRTLAGTGWVQTQTITELLRAHSPGTRPVLLKTSAGGAQGYIEESLLAEVRAAHAAVTDLAAMADATRTSVDTAHRLLYMAESRWWSRERTSPRDASTGLEYARRAQAVAEGELDKVRFLGMDSTLITGGRGAVDLEIQNDAGYPLAVELRLSPAGVELPEGEERPLELAPGRTELQVQVVRGDGPHSLGAELVAGSSTLDEVSDSLRFVTVGTVLPALIVAGLAIVVGAFFLVRRLLRRRRTVKAT